jgi:small subunit ribosomal protein S1
MQSDIDAPIRSLDGPEYVEVDGQMVPNYDVTMPVFDEGDVVSGRVVRIDKDEVLVDIGYKSEGVIPVGELSIRKSVNTEEEVSLGEVVDALVLQKEDQDGRLILSKKRARFEKAWKRIEEAATNGEMVTGKVIEVVKGGLILDLGVRGFLPASLVDIRRVQDLDEFLGRELECKVIELNRSRNNVVLSRRAVIEDERREVRQKILDELEPGAIVEGVISNIVDFGAFVDLDGIDGLIHISELSWSHVNHPSEVLQIGDRVVVKVLDIDRERQRISLGLKQTQADPWQSVVEAYQVGDVVAGKVTKVVTFGAFVEIHAGVEGLVHISELADHHVENPREVVSQGDEVAVRIIEIDGERRRLSLSLKRAGEQPFLNAGLGDEASDEGSAAEGVALADTIAEDALEASDEGSAAEAAALADTIAEDALEASDEADAAAEEAVVEAVVAEEVAEEAVEEAVVAEVVAQEAVEEAVVAEAKAESAVEQALVAQAAAEETAEQGAAEEAVVAEAAAQEAVDEAVVAETIAEAAVQQALAAEAAAREAVGDAVASEIVAEAGVEEAVEADVTAEDAVQDAALAEAEEASEQAGADGAPADEGAARSGEAGEDGA